MEGYVYTIAQNFSKGDNFSFSKILSVYEVPKTFIPCSMRTRSSLVPGYCNCLVSSNRSNKLVFWLSVSLQRLGSLQILQRLGSLRPGLATRGSYTTEGGLRSFCSCSKPTKSWFSSTYFKDPSHSQYTEPVLAVYSQITSSRPTKVLVWGANILSVPLVRRPQALV
jgi:hypothetical protein